MREQPKGHLAQGIYFSDFRHLLNILLQQMLKIIIKPQLARTNWEFATFWITTLKSQMDYLSFIERPIRIIKGSAKRI